MPMFHLLSQCSPKNCHLDFITSKECLHCSQKIFLVVICHHFRHLTHNVSGKHFKYQQEISCQPIFFNIKQQNLWLKVNKKWLFPFLFNPDVDILKCFGNFRTMSEENVEDNSNTPHWCTKYLGDPNPRLRRLDRDVC